MLSIFTKRLYFLSWRRGGTTPCRIFFRKRNTFLLRYIYSNNREKERFGPAQHFSSVWSSSRASERTDHSSTMAYSLSLSLSTIVAANPNAFPRCLLHQANFANARCEEILIRNVKSIYSSAQPFFYLRGELMIIRDRSIRYCSGNPLGWAPRGGSR